MSTSEGAGTDETAPAMAHPLLTLGATLAAMAVPAALAWWWWQRRERSGVSLDDILATETTTATSAAAVGHPGDDDDDAAGDGGLIIDDPLEAVKSAPWPAELPGLAQIIAYDDLKDEILDAQPPDAAESAAGLSAQDRQRLRHALMDRCQAHVAWLLRLEREQRSLDRMSRKGMISAADYAVFCAFAEKLDAEVTEVRDEAAWLCGDDDGAKGARAADEIWRIAVQIWQQRRQQQTRDARDKADREAEAAELKKKEAHDTRKAKARAAQAKKSLKGLKGGFLSAGGADKTADASSSDAAARSSTTRGPTAAAKAAAGGVGAAAGGASESAGGSKKNGGMSSSSSTSATNATRSSSRETDDDGDGGASYKAQRWPAELPGARQKLVYERLKQKTLHEYKTADLPEGDARQRLRNALMERCQAHVPLLSMLEHEQRRMRDAIEKSQWRSGTGAPSADDVGRFEAASRMAAEERKAVEEEAEWLGDRDGRAGMGARIWPTAYHVYQQMRAGHEEKARLAEAATAKAVEAYRNNEAKPWPTALPGAKARDEYERLKAAVLRRLPAPAQAAMLEGARPAPQIIGHPVARSLRQALMARAQQTVPLIQRLQTEGRAVRVAAERGHVGADELAAFGKLETALKAEVDAVKVEAEWLADDAARRGMGDQIWPAAFQIYNKRRAEIAAKVAEQQQGAASSTTTPRPAASSSAAAPVAEAKAAAPATTTTTTSKAAAATPSIEKGAAAAAAAASKGDDADVVD